MPPRSEYRSVGRFTAFANKVAPKSFFSSRPDPVEGTPMPADLDDDRLEPSFFRLKCLLDGDLLDSNVSGSCFDLDDLLSPLIFEESIDKPAAAAAAAASASAALASVSRSCL